MAQEAGQAVLLCQAAQANSCGKALCRGVEGEGPAQGGMGGAVCRERQVVGG